MRRLAEVLAADSTGACPTWAADPDPGMIAVTERRAAAAGPAGRTRWLRLP
ncbi:hypothetical protein [Streptomyces sp. NPDC005890]|uniref:hypothetical protein n=1 Tax=Streptomyces sp. NPDC005890 TaxID=3154568 RepID=UPI0033CBD828